MPGDAADPSPCGHRPTALGDGVGVSVQGNPTMGLGRQGKVGGCRGGVLLSCLPPWGKFRLGNRDGSRQLLGLQTIPSASGFCARAWASSLSSRPGSQPSLLLHPPPSRSRRLGSCPALPTWDTRRELSTAAVQRSFLRKVARLPARLLLGVILVPTAPVPCTDTGWNKLARRAFCLDAGSLVWAAWVGLAHAGQNALVS